MTQEDQSQPDATAVKDLFWEILEAKSQNKHEESDRVLREAKPQVRQAVEALLNAHQRASGVLLEETHQNDAPHTQTQTQRSDSPPTIAGYDIGEQIGQGGFGIVYRARQRTPIDRAVAVKVLRSEYVSDAAVSRFRAESSLLARLNHESIAQVYDAGLTEQGQPYVAMELIDGKPLVEACNAMGLGIKARVQLIIDACEAIQHAHQRAVIHRDLKPANVLVEHLGGSYRPRVIDFGIAKLLDADPNSEHTQAGIRLGTPRYMSPEQRQGGAAADTRVDVYALGAMLCELLAGDVPTSSPYPSTPDTADTISGSRISRPSKIASEQTSRVLVHPKTLRGDLDRIVLKACAADPELRYPSAQALAEDLRRYLDGRPVNASTPGIIYLSKKFVRRHRASVSLAGVLGVALLVALGIAALKWREAQEQRDRAIASAERTSFIGEFLLDMLLLSADSNARGAPPALTADAMQRIADRAADGLDEDPEHMLGMLEGIGRLQAQAGQAEAGAQTLRRALDYAINAYGLPNEQVIELRLRLHDLLWGHGLEGWKEQIQLADTESSQLYADDDPKRMRVVQRAQGTNENLERIIARYEQLEDIDPSDHYQALFAYSMQQRFGPTPEKQLESTRKLYEVATKYYPPDHTAVIDAMSLYGDAMTTYAPSDETVSLLLDAYERSVRVLGFDHFTTESIRRGLARVYGALGQPLQGIPYAQADLDSVTKVYGVGSIQHSNALLELGKLYRLAGELEPSRECFEQALRGKQSQWSVGHAQITTVQVLLSQVLVELSDFDGADELAADAMTHLEAKKDAKTYASAMRVRIAVRAQAQDDGGGEELMVLARDHLDQFGYSREAIDQMLNR